MRVGGLMLLLTIGMMAPFLSNLFNLLHYGDLYLAMTAKKVLSRI